MHQSIDPSLDMSPAFGNQTESSYYSILRVVKKFSLDRLDKWKLDPAFAKKYTCFDVENIVTKLPVVSYSAAMADMH